MLFSHGTVPYLKRTVNLNSSRVSQLDRTVQSGFNNLGFYLEHIHRARLFADRSFHSLVTLQRLATWGLGLEPSLEALAHELTTHRRKFLLKFLIIICFS